MKFFYRSIIIPISYDNTFKHCADARVAKGVDQRIRLLL